MGKPTSSIERSRIVRRGYTLVEAMIASALLSVSVLAISGAISASYAQDEYAREKREALSSSSQLLEEVTSLPIDAATAGDASIMNYSNYTDEAAINELTTVVTTSTQVVAATTFSAVEEGAPTPKKAKRKITVKRRVSPTGAESATGDFAIVGVAVQQGDHEVQVSRLVTAAEANATR